MFRCGVPARNSRRSRCWCASRLRLRTPNRICISICACCTFIRESSLQRPYCHRRPLGRTISRASCRSIRFPMEWETGVSTIMTTPAPCSYLETWSRAKRGIHGDLSGRSRSFFMVGRNRSVLEGVSMKKILRISLALLLMFAMHSVVRAQNAETKDAVYYPAASALQTETDEYTRYELLDPETSSFKIHYEVTATTAGAKFFYNPIRKGSVASDESVYDAMSGKLLHFEVVSGAEARKDALMADADLDTEYIKVTLARPVPKNGQGRVIIVKTYKDAKSYYVDGKAIVFKRPLGIQRDKVVLPAGYEVVGLTVPSQILTESDGRIAISFLHAGEGEAPLELRAVKDAQTGERALPGELTKERSWE